MYTFIIFLICSFDNSLASGHTLVFQLKMFQGHRPLFCKFLQLYELLLLLNIVASHAWKLLPGCEQQKETNALRVIKKCPMDCKSIVRSMFMGAVELESITFFFFWDGGLSRQIGIHESLDITKKKKLFHT